MASTSQNRRRSKPRTKHPRSPVHRRSQQLKNSRRQTKSRRRNNSKTNSRRSKSHRNSAKLRRPNRTSRRSTPGRSRRKHQSRRAPKRTLGGGVKNQSNNKEQEHISTFISASLLDLKRQLIRIRDNATTHTDYLQIVHDLKTLFTNFASMLQQTYHDAVETPELEGQTDANNYLRSKGYLKQFAAAYLTIVGHVFGEKIKNNLGTQIGFVLGRMAGSDADSMPWRTFKTGVGISIGKAVGENFGKS